jgi:hypothetical protein
MTPLISIATTRYDLLHLVLFSCVWDIFVDCLCPEDEKNPLWLLWLLSPAVVMRYRVGLVNQPHQLGDTL